MDKQGLIGYSISEDYVTLAFVLFIVFLFLCMIIASIIMVEIDLWKKRKGKK